MTQQHYRVAKATKDALVVKESTTTSAGNVGGTTLVDSALTEGANYWAGATVVILDGSSKGQSRDVSAFSGGTITVTDAFASQIATNTRYKLITFRPTEVEITALQTDVGDASASTLGSLYAILGNPSASLAATILDGIDGRANNPTLNALLGVTDASGRSINGNIGDFQAQTNLQTLLAALGIPDVAAKPLYTCLITDRLDSVTYGLSALNTDLDAIILDTKYIFTTAIGTPTAFSVTDILKVSATEKLKNFIAKTGGTEIPTGKALYDYLQYLTGDSYVRLGAPIGASISADIATVDANVDVIVADTPYLADAALPVTPTAGSIGALVKTNLDAPVSVVDTVVDAIKLKTDNLPSDPADESLIEAAITTAHGTTDGKVDAIKAQTDVIVADTPYLADAALPASPTAGSLARFIASGGTALGTQLPASKSLYDVTVVDRLAGAEYTGTVSAGTAVETTLKEIVTTTRTEIKSIWLDLNTLTANATIKLYHKIDGTTYRVFETDSWLFASDDKGVLITGFTINNDFKITITGSEGVGVNIIYNIPYQIMES